MLRIASALKRIGVRWAPQNAVVELHYIFDRIIVGSIFPRFIVAKELLVP